MQTTNNLSNLQAVPEQKNIEVGFNPISSFPPKDTYFFTQRLLDEEGNYKYRTSCKAYLGFKGEVYVSIARILDHKLTSCRRGESWNIKQADMQAIKEACQRIAFNHFFNPSTSK